MACHSLLGWYPVSVESKSERGAWYNVWTSPWNPPDEYICECEGYGFRGHCSHQEKAEERVCRWSSLTGPEEQTKEQRQGKVCPRCYGPAQWIMEEVEDAQAEE